jgi:CRISPR/Cas system-associated endoribonuclease Cas2
MLNKLFRQFEKEFIGQSKEWHPVNESVYCGRISDAELEAMRKRNEESISKRIEEMGEKWIMHPANQVQRLGHERK